MRRLAFVLLLACSKKTEQAAPPAAKLDKLTITVDGKRLAIDRAFIKQTSPDVHTVILGAGRGSCTEDGSVAFTIAKRVVAAGTERAWITDVWSRDFDAKVDVPVAAELDGTKLAIEVRGPKLELRGTFEAVACPDVPPTGMGVPKGKHVSHGAITVAGKRLDIQGVTVQTRPGVAPTDLPNIKISTNLVDCSAVTLPAPIILERIDGTWSMHGTWLSAPQVATEITTLSFNANNVGKSVDGPTLDLQLSGSGKLGDYAVKLEGAAQAVECVR